MIDVSCYITFTNDVLLKVRMPLKPQRTGSQTLLFTAHAWDAFYGTIKSEHRTKI